MGVYVGRMRHIIAASARGGSGKHKAMRVFSFVPKDDVTASYLCHPYARVSLEGGAVKLTRNLGEHHEMQTVADNTSDVLHYASDSGSDSDSGSSGSDLSDSADEEDEFAAQAQRRAHEHRKQRGVVTASNIKDEVAVLWHAHPQEPQLENEADGAILRQLVMQHCPPKAAAPRNQVCIEPCVSVSWACPVIVRFTNCMCGWPCVCIYLMCRF